MRELPDANCLLSSRPVRFGFLYRSRSFIDRSTGKRIFGDRNSFVTFRTFHATGVLLAQRKVRVSRVIVTCPSSLVYSAEKASDAYRPIATGGTSCCEGLNVARASKCGCRASAALA